MFHQLRDIISPESIPQHGNEPTRVALERWRIENRHEPTRFCFEDPEPHLDPDEMELPAEDDLVGLLRHVGLSQRSCNMLERNVTTVSEAREAVLACEIHTWPHCGLDMERKVMAAIQKLDKLRRDGA